MQGGTHDRDAICPSGERPRGRSPRASSFFRRLYTEGIINICYRVPIARGPPRFTPTTWITGRTLNTLSPSRVREHVAHARRREIARVTLSREISTVERKSLSLSPVRTHVLVRGGGGRGSNDLYLSENRVLRAATPFLVQ